MKKIAILGLGCLAMLATGCGSKKLNCTMEQDSMGNKISQNIVATFSGDEISKLDMEVETKLADAYVEHIDMFATQLESQFESLKDKKGITTKTTKKDNSVIFTVNIDVKSMDEDAKDALGVVNTKGSYKDSKKQLEAQGYTCK